MANSKTLWTSAAATLSLVILGGASYYLWKEDQQVKKRNLAKTREKKAASLLREINNDHKMLHAEIDEHYKLMKLAGTSVPEKEWKTIEFKLSMSNEMLLRLMERLDAIRPLADIMDEDDREPTKYEKEIIAEIKQKKRRIISKIERDFKRLDTYKSNMPTKEISPPKEQSPFEEVVIESKA
ncbi:hypothetical protein F4703DRAFT_1373224 [Phycomyces blakesleeanus]|uniref:Uncharacterized protein n=1 Tax=Phycomyces blakesleeanus (strain ATCC 8743b / DSM 1359 / FGSC 10004 / NBRC 33097 / NRRL 1555) TaxID=763407 RepID=A0A167NGX8_PHYB8|nr:hypothetical protein PHYBLDRAFT_142868 [Phycomyces blakesleeanus NRRL 1555(-)]OAD75884.1 hypothetical protein PHYBLDRAFT_142868 [Phycomyces blakesleeanus NRRL 1555(-)]|eukprot:XP_018293924.1 hypothetical protein PHYBLDRAFT_142868 [Phycomyces blakesleeanus NRRL 1555(-)]